MAGGDQKNGTNSSPRRNHARLVLLWLKILPKTSSVGWPDGVPQLTAMFEILTKQCLFENAQRTGYASAELIMLINSYTSLIVI